MVRLIEAMELLLALSGVGPLWSLKGALIRRCCVIPVIFFGGDVVSCVLMAQFSTALCYISGSAAPVRLMEAGPPPLVEVAWALIQTLPINAHIHGELESMGNR